MNSIYDIMNKIDDDASLGINRSTRLSESVDNCCEEEEDKLDSSVNEGIFGKKNTTVKEILVKDVKKGNIIIGDDDEQHKVTSVEDDDDTHLLMVYKGGSMSAPKDSKISILVKESLESVESALVEGKDKEKELFDEIAPDKNYRTVEDVANDVAVDVQSMFSSALYSLYKKGVYRDGSTPSYDFSQSMYKQAKSKNTDARSYLHALKNLLSTFEQLKPQYENTLDEYIEICTGVYKKGGNKLGNFMYSKLGKVMFDKVSKELLEIYRDYVQNKGMFERK